MKNIQEIKADFGKAFAEVSTIAGLSVTDTIQIAIAVLQEYGKYSRGEAMREGKDNGNNKDMPATEKQVSALNKFGAKFPETITKAEASELLDKLIVEAKKKKGG